jgi:hypothetical protein
MSGILAHPFAGSNFLESWTWIRTAPSGTQYTEVWAQEPDGAFSYVCPDADRQDPDVWGPDLMLYDLSAGETSPDCPW